MLGYIVDECAKWNGLFDSAEVEIWAAEFAVVFAGGQVFFCREAHALAVLPDVAALALDHESHIFRLSLWMTWGIVIERISGLETILV